MFQNPTIAAFAKQVTNGTGGLLQPSISAILPRPNDIPLSFSQERLWFIDRLEGSIQYHIPSLLRLKGSLNRSALSHALETLVNRHEVLRTVYIEKAGQAYQFVSNKNEWKLSIIDGGIFNEDQSQLQQYIEAEISRPFDLTKDYMLRAVLINLDKQEHLLVVTMHHIASDGWSLSIMVNEIAEAYAAYNEGRVITLNPLEVQYADYAIWQRNYLNDEVLNNKISYWKEKLRDVVSLQLPATYKRPVVQSTRGAIVAFDIDNGLTSQLYELGKQNGATLFMTLLGVFKILMHRYSGQEDICVGSPIANRTQNEVEELIGFFVNTLALRSNLKGDMLFADLLQQVKDTTMEAYANQEVPFEKIVEAVVRVRDVSRTPLFQVMFALNNTPAVPALHLGGLHLTVEEARHTTSQFDLSFNIIENVKGLNGVVEYCTDLYDDKAIQRMIIHFKNLISSIVQDPAQKIGKLSMLSPAENHQLLEEFNNTATAYPKNKSIVDLFEEQVIKTPGETAIVFEGQQLTYNELNGRSNQLANYLNKIGVEPGNNIGLLSPRGPDMIISIFGILKAGCTYVPFNVEYPAERLNYIIEDAEIKHIICPSLELIPSAGFENCKIIHPEEAFSCSSNSYKISIAVDAPAYIMYTSGTTGKPKGIAVSHKNILKLVFEPGVIKVNPQDRMLQWSNFAFDGSVYEIFCSLLVGASLYLIKDDWSSNVFELNRVIEEQNITICFVTTALFNSFIDINPGMLKGLRKILFGGELVSPSHVKKALHTAGANKIIHVYGPTETTVYATCYAIDEVGVQATIPIGKPLSNTSLYVLDNYMQLVPVGVTGELFIGGDGVSLGYVNNKKLTNEKFVSNPLRDAEVDRIYRTGDLVRMLPDGNIEYLGRKDNQVIIRGYRIEPEEIEGLVLESGLVQQAVVMVKEDSNSNKRLVGYISTDKDFDKRMLNNYLHARLPAYMVPGLWVEMSSMPLNANGKIDKKALPYTDSDQLLTNTYVAPRTELEERLVKIWMDLLGLERVGVEDNFFELGGHSLLAMRLISAIQRELNLQVAVKELFEFTTISELSKYLEIRSGVPEKDTEAYDLLVI